MQNPPDLFDLNAQRKNRARAHEMFLQNLAADDLQERLKEVNRTFTHIAIVTPFPAIWKNRLPDAEIVQPDEVLEFSGKGYDLVLHALCLHGTNDPVGQIIQSRRRLAPDGLFLATFFGGQSLVELRACLAEAESKVTGGLSPRINPMAEIRDVGGLLQRAGLALPVADSTNLTLTYAAPFDLMTELRAMGEGNALSQRQRTFTRRAILTEAAKLYIENYPAEDGRIRASCEIITLTGWAPSDTQQKPLRPGSAQQRLADALGSTEEPLDPATKD